MLWYKNNPKTFLEIDAGQEKNVHHDTIMNKPTICLLMCMHTYLYVNCININPESTHQT